MKQGQGRARGVGLAALVCLALEAVAAPRAVPPKGIDAPAHIRVELEQELGALSAAIRELRAMGASDPKVESLLPDVEIFRQAVHYALTHNEFYKTNEFRIAKELARQGTRRAHALRDGAAPWTKAVGLVVRGYRSRVDGSAQPYGVVVPAGYASDPARPRRADIWFHGRDDRLTELKFIHQRQTSIGPVAPPDAFVIHPYGRYCNGFKFAGETDVFEALDHARANYPIDGRRLAVRGFSMGGAACWHIAAHHAGQWAAAAPGAGFAETPEYLNIAARSNAPPWHEQRLWTLYNATDYAANFTQLPVIAYSGERDKQIQAANAMASALAVEGLSLSHVIGPGMGHKYHPDSKRAIDQAIDAILSQGRDLAPRRVRFATWTLRYNRMAWIVVDGLEEHWKRARVEAEIVDGDAVRLFTENIVALSIDMPAGACPLPPDRRPVVFLNQQALSPPRPLTDRSWRVSFLRDRAGQWRIAGDDPAPAPPLRKRHGLQGPIDDAFMDGFVFVPPDPQPDNQRPAHLWAVSESVRAAAQWRAQFRGDAPTKAPAALTEQDVAQRNLVLWGGPDSTPLIARLVKRLPLRWDGDALEFNGKTYPSDRFVPKLIFPNPLNPDRYIVLNSGFTFAYPVSGSNADQTPKLPDWAVVETAAASPHNAQAGVVDAGFFDEHWRLPAAKRSAASQDRRVSFSRDIAPLFASKCLACHNRTKAKGGFRLDTYQALAGSSAVAPRRPEESLLLALLRTENVDERMPQDDPPLSASAIAAVSAWIEQGAPFDGDDPAQSVSLFAPETPGTAPDAYPPGLPASSLAFSPDGASLLVGGRREIIIRDADDGALISRIPCRSRRVHALACAPGEGSLRWYAVGGAPGRRGRVESSGFEFDESERPFLAAALSPDGRRLAAGGEDGVVTIFATATGLVLNRFRQHSDWITALAFDPSGDWLASGSRDRTARLYRLADNDVGTALRGHGAAVRDLAFADNSTVLYTASDDKTVRVWDLQRLSAKPKTVPCHANALALASAGENFYVGLESGRALLFDKEGKQKQTFEIAKTALLSLTLDRSRTKVAAGDRAGRLHIWPVTAPASRATLAALPQHTKCNETTK